MRDFLHVWGLPYKSDILSFSLSLSLSLCSIVLETPVLPRTCYVYLRSFSSRFFDSPQVLFKWVQSRAAIEAYRRPKTPDLIQAAAWFIMATSAFLSCKSIDPAKDFVVDLDVAISETILNFGPLHHTKQLLADNSHAISPSFCSNLAQFALEPTYPYPELVH